MGNLFTPRHAATDQRLRMKISDADRAAFNALPRGDGGASVIVTDPADGRRYTARRAACSLDCFCDAVVTPVPEDTAPNGYEIGEPAGRVQIVKLEPAADRWAFVAHGARYEPGEAAAMRATLEARGCLVQFLPARQG